MIDCLSEGCAAAPPDTLLTKPKPPKSGSARWGTETVQYYIWDAHEAGDLTIHPGQEPPAWWLLAMRLGAVRELVMPGSDYLHHTVRCADGITHADPDDIFILKGDGTLCVLHGATSQLTWYTPQDGGPGAWTILIAHLKEAVAASNEWRSGEDDGTLPVHLDTLRGRTPVWTTTVDDPAPPQVGVAWSTPTGVADLVAAVLSPTAAALAGYERTAAHYTSGSALLLTERVDYFLLDDAAFTDGARLLAWATRASGPLVHVFPDLARIFVDTPYGRASAQLGDAVVRRSDGSFIVLAHDQAVLVPYQDPAVDDPAVGRFMLVKPCNDTRLRTSHRLLDPLDAVKSRPFPMSLVD